MTDREKRERVADTLDTILTRSSYLSGIELHGDRIEFTTDVWDDDNNRPHRVVMVVVSATEIER